MSQFDPKVEEYIAELPDFAREILEHCRILIHETCPEVGESMKWSIPHFDYKNDFMCAVTAYKNYCSIHFMKAQLMQDTRINSGVKLDAKKRFLGQIKSVRDLPSDKELIGFIKDAMSLNEHGIKLKRKTSDKPKVLPIPKEFAEELDKHSLAKEIFLSKSDSYRKDYIVWIADAKTDDTRLRRMEEAIEWISEGKSRFWKYAKK